MSSDKIIRAVKDNNLISRGILYKMTKVPGQEELVPESAGQYGFPLAPDTFQGKRVQWSPRQNKWLTDLEDSELQALVQRASLRHVDGPRKGEVITKANIFDEYDPFFSHPEFNMWLEMGHKKSSEANAIEKIVLSNFYTRKEVESSKNKRGRFRGSHVEFEVVDTDHDQTLKDMETELELDAGMLIKKSNVTKKLKLCSILSINANKDMTEKTLNTLILDVFKVDKSKRDKFLEYAKLPNDKLDIKYYVKRAEVKRIIQWSSSKNVYVFNGKQDLFRSWDQIEEFFGKEENYGFYEELKELVG